jgi:hypothetical protein
MENIKKEAEPKLPDAESKEILDEIAAEEKAKAEKSGEDKTIPPKEPDKGKKSDKDDDSEDGQKNKDAGDKKEGEDGEEDGDKKPKRTPKLMPLFEHEIAKKDWEKSQKEKDQKILELTQQLQDKSTPDKTADIKKFAEESGLEESTVKGLVDIILKSMPNQGTALDEKTKKKLQAFEDSQAELVEKQGFEKEYSEKVIPTFEKQGISEDKRGRIKLLLEKLAFTTKYANYDLDHIFLIDPSFDSFKEKGKPSGESSRGAPHTEGGEDKSVMEMTDKEFDEWSETQGKKQSSRKVTRIVNGERVQVR